MNKKIKYIISILLIFTTLFSLTGCKDKEEKNVADILNEKSKTEETVVKEEYNVDDPEEIEKMNNLEGEVIKTLIVPEEGDMFTILFENKKHFDNYASKNNFIINSDTDSSKSYVNQQENQRKEILYSISQSSITSTYKEVYYKNTFKPEFLDSFVSVTKDLYGIDITDFYDQIKETLTNEIENEEFSETIQIGRISVILSAVEDSLHKNGSVFLNFIIFYTPSEEYKNYLTEDIPFEDFTYNREEIDTVNVKIMNAFKNCKTKDLNTNYISIINEFKKAAKYFNYEKYDLVSYEDLVSGTFKNSETDELQKEISLFVKNAYMSTDVTYYSTKMEEKHVNQLVREIQTLYGLDINQYKDQIMSIINSQEKEIETTINLNLGFDNSSISVYKGASLESLLPNYTIIISISN